MVDDNSAKIGLKIHNITIVTQLALLEEKAAALDEAGIKKILKQLMNLDSVINIDYNEYELYSGGLSVWLKQL